jgi:DNA-binding XRE family transcriptional regulator
MKKLKARRLALGITQARVAMLSGVTERCYHSHENGAGRRCPWPARESIARALGCSVSVLFDERGVAR